MNTFSILTQYIDIFDKNKNYGDLRMGYNTTNTPVKSQQKLNVFYSLDVNNFLRDLDTFCKLHPEYDQAKYIETLKSNNISIKELGSASVTNVDAKCIIAMLMCTLRAEQYCNGVLLNFFKKGAIQRWIKRLAEIDSND